ncbi:YfbM family protein [Flavobacterium sp. DG1-102-2]|uniref:YfbM family protein n=1 Tax=Flavobacterium sp. DG1-102-2 TaxID=3081663 RepID=UPI00294A12A5|nr:YfbM family protein [Flavobacterium sp. DG1-102-2]MDV6167457.1 YfbM family protein [Flavobacterium sp. DG1-102-2]
MGMIFNIVRVSKEELKDCLRDTFLFDYKLDAIFNNENDDAWVDIDKSWGGILFMLTGGGLNSYEHPLAKVLFSGQKITAKGPDSHYEMADYLDPEQVKEVCAEIAKISNKELMGRFDPIAMNEEKVYPGGVWDESRFKNVLQSFEVLKGIYLKAAERNEAIITFIS